MKKPILSPRFVGERFEQGEIPLEVLRDIAVLQDLLVEVAKAKYLEANPKRQRVPRGFQKRLGLRLRAVREGSAIPDIVSAEPESQLSMVENVYLASACDCVTDAIEAAASGGSPRDHLPDKAFTYFDRFGKSLRENERIDFTRADKVISFDQKVRERLRSSLPADETYVDESTVRGELVGGDAANKTLGLMMANGKRLAGPMNRSDRDLVAEEMKQYGTGRKVEVTGIVRFHRTKGPLAIEEIFEIETLDPLDVPARLDELAALEDGWLDGKGVAITRSQADRLADWFASHFADELPLPHLYPTPEGGVLAEWAVGEWATSVEFEFEPFRVELHDYNIESDELRERTFALDQPNQTRELLELLNGRLGSQE